MPHEAQKKPSHEAVPQPPMAAPPGGQPLDLRESQLVSFGDRMTYTFAYGKEVGSIHFDRARGEIFYKGHNVRNMDLEDWQMQALEQLRQILDTDENGKGFVASYNHTLDKVILEKRGRSVK